MQELTFIDVSKGAPEQYLSEIQVFKWKKNS